MKNSVRDEFAFKRQPQEFCDEMKEARGRAALPPSNGEGAERRPQLSAAAIARWENEGGAVPLKPL